MTTVILLLLAIAWVAVLLPTWFRNRSEARIADSVLSFRQQLTTLQRATPAGRDALSAAQAAPRAAMHRRAATRRRRRTILIVLTALSAFALVAAVVVQGLAIVAFAVSAVLLSTYVGLLIRLQKRLVRRANVHYLANRRRTAEPALQLRRSASN